MTIQYNSLIGLPQEPLYSSLVTLLAGVFVNQSPEEIAADLTYHQHRTPLVLLFATDHERLVGCKIGYERQPGHFYSWLGCVDPAYRGRGIASELMRRQHDWCCQNGYHTVRTHTYNAWREMLLLNLRHGFDIIGTMQGKYGLTIMLEKKN
ncbi:N-acetyltransferase [Fibrisoma montanum]|uniref:N-acetyltransferase n=1 Tax=Fibrisoma montanum TaxID=2305895 RepID=A0A418LXT7_9BACT|nr:GNAT family N-acetyltransferase [Fibrisoma montanum]RIV18084.1 N-acetyltransferase [Fibrisoma montanum]